jgi:hypothetical protein
MPPRPTLVSNFAAALYQAKSAHRKSQRQLQHTLLSGSTGPAQTQRQILYHVAAELGLRVWRSPARAGRTAPPAREHEANHRPGLPPGALRLVVVGASAWVLVPGRADVRLSSAHQQVRAMLSGIVARAVCWDWEASVTLTWT